MNCPKCGSEMIDSPGMLVINREGFPNGSKWRKCFKCGHEEKVKP